MQHSTSSTSNTNGTEQLLKERSKTHGDYREVARIAQAFKVVMRQEPGWAALTEMQRESLDLIATKIARIISGDAECPDHWEDISGYALLPIRRP